MIVGLSRQVQSPQGRLSGRAAEVSGGVEAAVHDGISPAKKSGSLLKAFQLIGLGPSRLSRVVHFKSADGEY